jgi:hypothetical protein
MDQERTTESQSGKEFTFWYPSACRHADGHLFAGTSSYAEPGIHSSGAATIVPDNPDYELWLWIVARLESIERGRISDKDKERFRAEFEQEREQASSSAAFREQLLAAVPICPKPTIGERLYDVACAIIAAPFMLLFLLSILVSQSSLWGKLTAMLRTKR